MDRLRRVTVRRRRPGRSRHLDQRWRWRAAAAAGGLAAAVALATAPALAGTATRAGHGPEPGIDISAYQHANGPIDWRGLARHGIRFVALKVSEGDYYRNPYYQPDARAASRAGLAVLAYAFADPDRTPGAATASFAVRAAGGRRGSLPLVVDLENDPYAATDCYWFSPRAMIAWIAGFVTRVRALTGSWPVIYTTDAWWSECTGDTARFRRDPLWLADYGGGAGPSAPSPWRQWSFWQYSQDGYLPGIGSTDLDYFQPAPGLPSLRQPSEPKARHRHRHRHPERKPKRTRTNQKRHSKTIRKHNQ